jgi:hypothetical protein
VTKAEVEWMDRIVELGCCACREMGYPGTSAEVHHLLKGGRRIGHLFSIPLCAAHHRGGRNDEEIVSRHPWRRAFESRYGTELELLEKTRELVQRREVLASRGETEAISQ